MMLFALGASSPADLQLIDDLNECMTARFEAPAPNALGMSRIMGPRSFGTHYQPFVTRDRDFTPENARETKAMAALEDSKMQVGLYLFGKAVEDEQLEILNFRALKGPGAVTAGTPRPAWYPGVAELRMASADALPDWKTVYPLARKAMKSFADGGKGFETTLDSWHIAARPLLAESERCVSCHQGKVTLHQPIGGVLYAYRRAGT
jgi:hypothetical protein